MAKSTGIIWAKSTFNAWIGCTQVSPACDHCYAKAMFDDRLHKAKWGPGMPRVRTSPAHWKEPLKWNREAPDSEFMGRTGFWPVFVNSASDVFDNEVPDAWRAELFTLIHATPNLTWLLLTKRIGNAAKMIFEAYADAVLNHGAPAWPWPNVWLGATVVNQEEADRDIPKLLAVPAAKRFLSIEPMLGPISLTRLPMPIKSNETRNKGAAYMGQLNALSGLVLAPFAIEGSNLDWVIAGGESGAQARPAHPDWFRSLRDQCAAAGVPFFFKQWGEYFPLVWFDGPDSERDDDIIFFDADREPHLFLANDGRTWDTNGGRYMYPPLPLGNWCLMHRRGTKAAGNHLDGRQHLEFPQP